MTVITLVMYFLQICNNKGECLCNIGYAGSACETLEGM